MRTFVWIKTGRAYFILSSAFAIAHLMWKTMRCSVLTSTISASLQFRSHLKIYLLKVNISTGDLPFLLLLIVSISLRLLQSQASLAYSVRHRSSSCIRQQGGDVKVRCTAQRKVPIRLLHIVRVRNSSITTVFVFIPPSPEVRARFWYLRGERGWQYLYEKESKVQ